MRPAIRLSALSHYPSIWIYTHDSIGVGEDGPTHQPVEHLAALRSIPDLVVIRPADSNEVREAWRVAIERRTGPTALILTRQNLPVFDRSDFAPANGLRRGAYIMADLGRNKPDIILMASGSEVQLIVQAAIKLQEEGITTRIVSFPSWELFAAQEKAYRNEVLPPSIAPRLAVEVGVAQGWDRWVGDHGAVISIEKFGASAPYQVIYKNYGFTVENIIERVKTLLLK
jgi:transketolase